MPGTRGSLGLARGKGCDEPRPAAGRSVDLDRAAVGVRDPAHDWEAESRARAVIRKAIKAFKDPFALVWGDAVAIVVDDDFAEAPGAARADVHDLMGVTNGILEQVHGKLAKTADCLHQASGDVIDFLGGIEAAQSRWPVARVCTALPSTNCWREGIGAPSGRDPESWFATQIWESRTCIRSSLLTQGVPM